MPQQQSEWPPKGAKVTWEATPSQTAAAIAPAPMPASPQDPYPKLSSYPSNIGIGAMKGFGGSVHNVFSSLPEVIQEGIRRYGAMNPFSPQELSAGLQMSKTGEVPNPPVPPDAFKATNFPQSIGRGAEQMGEYMLGGGMAGAATGGAGLGYRMLGQGLAGAGVSGMHGGTPEEMAGTGLVTSLLPAAHEGLRYLYHDLQSAFGNTFLGRLLFRNRTIPQPTPPINAEFVEGAPPDIDVPWRPVRAGAIGPGTSVQGPPPPPPTPPRQITTGQPAATTPPRPQGGMPSGPKPKTPIAGVKEPRMLGDSGVKTTPPGTESINLSDPRLPSRYASTKVSTEGPAGPGVMGRANQGQPGGIPSKIQDVTPVPRIQPVKLPDGTMHVPSSEEAGRGYIVYRGPKGQFQRFDIPGGKSVAKGPTPPPK